MSNTVKETSPCPSCGKPLPAGALAGLCPVCLLAQGADTDPGGGATRFEPPPLAEVAKLFPQLEILDLLGAGGMGAVYKARQPALDRIVALKILPSQNARGVNFAERFNREARALAKLSHPNIVAVHEFGQAGALSYFIMEFVDGANLRLLEQGSRLSPREALQIIPQICDALQYAHDEGVVHRDIKPENVLVDRKGRVKIADFGLAKILGVDADALRLTAEGQVMGTPHYMAPEQIEKPLSVDHRADIYALGVVLYEMLTGDLPLGKFPPPSRKVQVDVRLDDVVLRALENDPARRYQRASEVKSQVETIAGTPAPSAASAPGHNFIRWAGFPLVIEREGLRTVNRKEVFKAFAILFGVLTIVFGLVSLVTGGQTLFGWLGISGSASLKVRLQIAVLVTVFAVWRAWRSPSAATRPLPQTPQGTAILPPEEFSRKAIIGAIWAPLFFIAIVLGYLSLGPALTGVPDPPDRAWPLGRGLSTLLILLPGLVAPFGTTILGWIAVGDIRRGRGRINGLPLAVFDGLFFPLLALNGVLANAAYASVQWAAGRWDLNPQPWNLLTGLIVVGTTFLCGGVNIVIVRRVWRAVRLGVEAHAGADWWWNTRRGGVTIALSCALIISLVVGQRSVPELTGRSEYQIGQRDPQTGRAPNAPLESTSPYSGSGAALEEPPRLRFLAWQDDWEKNQPSGAWHPDGSPVVDAAEMDLLRAVSAAKVNVEAVYAGRAQPRFLHVWFSHPLFELQGLNNVTLLDEFGALIKLGGNGTISSKVHSPVERSETGWLITTLSPDDLGRIPDSVTVRLRYAVGPLEREQEVAVDYEGGMSLEGSSQLSGIGQSASGRAFVALAVDSKKTAARHFGVLAVTRDGRVMADSGRSSSGNQGSDVRVEEFEFNTALSGIVRFRIGTRPVRTMEWTNVVLRVNKE